MGTAGSGLSVALGVKSDMILYRYSYRWLFRLMQSLGVRHLQLGTFFEMYQLPDGFFTDLRTQASEHGVEISSVFTAHRELGGFYREDGPGFVEVAARNLGRLIEIGGLVGARRVGHNPGAVLRDRMETKAAGTRIYLEHFRRLMGKARDVGLEWLSMEPMSCLAEPPTLPEEMAEFMGELEAVSGGRGTRAGMCVDVAHGYADVNRVVKLDHWGLMEAALPWTCEIHLKNTDATYDSTFGFSAKDRARGIIDVPAVRAFYERHSSRLPVRELVGYLEIGGPKLGRDYSDVHLEGMLRESLEYLKESWLGGPRAEGRGPSGAEGVVVAPSMMCVDMLHFESALRAVEGLGGGGGGGGGVGMLHVDVMDGHYVPNVSMGLPLIDQLAVATKLPLDIHLMVENNDFYVEHLKGLGARSGGARIAVHLETCRHLDGTLSRIREYGMKAGVAINPGTSAEAIGAVLERVDYVLVMTVNPGFAGQKLVPGAMRKIADVRRLLDSRGYKHVPIEVDGNVSFENIPGMVAAGAEVLVAGTSSIFHAGASWAENLGKIRAAVAEGKKRNHS